MLLIALRTCHEFASRPVSRKAVLPQCNGVDLVYLPSSSAGLCRHLPRSTSCLTRRSNSLGEGPMPIGRKRDRQPQLWTSKCARENILGAERLEVIFAVFDRLHTRCEGCQNEKSMTTMCDFHYCRILPVCDVSFTLYNLVGDLLRIRLCTLEALSSFKPVHILCQFRI